jgi:hypothetical protein
MNLLPISVAAKVYYPSQTTSQAGAILRLSLVPDKLIILIERHVRYCVSDKSSHAIRKYNLELIKITCSVRSPSQVKVNIKASLTPEYVCSPTGENGQCASTERTNDKSSIVAAFMLIVVQAVSSKRLYFSMVCTLFHQNMSMATK